MTPDRKAEILDRVRKLLDKADGTNFPHEADAFRNKAEQLMVAYAIESWQVDHARDAASARPVPVTRRVTGPSLTGADHNVHYWLMDCYRALAHHCRCFIADRDFATGEYVLCGMPADLDYLDLLFTSVRMEFSGKLMPRWQADRTFDENVFALREAGNGWHDIARASGMYAELYIPKTGRISGKVFGAYRRECAKRNVKPHGAQNPETYRDSFAYGFAQELRQRLAVMSQQATAGDASGSMALALRDIRDVVREYMYTEFPNLRPHPADCECKYCKPPVDNKPVKRTRVPKYKETPINYDALRRGREVGANVRLNVRADQRLGSRKEIEG